MPARNQALIRRGINRLNDLITQQAGAHPPLAVISDMVNEATVNVNKAWQTFQHNQS